MLCCGLGATVLCPDANFSPVVAMRSRRTVLSLPSTLGLTVHTQETAVWEETLSIKMISSSPASMQGLSPGGHLVVS